jgi:hypothetical protein
LQPLLSLGGTELAEATCLESTRIWLARAIEADLEPLGLGLQAWLEADSSLAGREGPQAFCPGILRDLVAWLKADPVPGPRPPAGRPASLARSFVLEHLKRTGAFDRETRERRHEALLLLEHFFGEAGAERPTGWGRMPRPERTGQEVS